MKFLKKTLIVLLLAAFCIPALSACSSSIIYPVEKEVKDYVKEMTKGYSQLVESPSLKLYTLYSEEKVLIVKLKQGLTTAPSIELTVGKTKAKTTEKELCTVYQTVDGNETVYGAASALSTYFDPYRNKYVPCMRVYKKDDRNFRVLFFIINSGNDFSPFYLAFTSEGYKKALNGVSDYAALLKRSFSTYKTDEYGEQVETPDYLTEFKGMFLNYKSYANEIEAMYGEKFTNLKAENAYVLFQCGANYTTLLEDVLPYYGGMNMQAVRKEYEKLGYTGYNLNMIIVAADMTVSEDGSTFSVTMNDNVFYSEAARASGAEYSFVFCPTLNAQ